MIGAESRSDVARDCLGCNACGIAARIGTPDPVSHDENRRESGAPQGKRLRIRQTRAVNHHLWVNGTDKEMILVFGPHVTTVRNAEQIELLVCRSARLLWSGGCSRFCECHNSPFRTARAVTMCVAAGQR